MLAAETLADITITGWLGNLFTLVLAILQIVYNMSISQQKRKQH